MGRSFIHEPVRKQILKKSVYLSSCFTLLTIHKTKQSYKRCIYVHSIGMITKSLLGKLIGRPRVTQHHHCGSHVCHPISAHLGSKLWEAIWSKVHNWNSECFWWKWLFMKEFPTSTLKCPLLTKETYLKATNMPLTDKHWSLNVCQELMGLLILSFKALEILTRYNTQD